VLTEESDTQVRWFLADHQGTVKDVVDNAGTVIDHITYDSFGRIVSQTNSIELRFAYTGREWDGETGQYYYRARYYNHADGRFISEDPIGFSGGDSNLIRYVGNSATNFIDPNGLEAAVATATVATTAATTTAGSTLLSTLLLPVTLVAAPVTAVFWATPAGGGRPEDIAAANNRPKLEPPLPQSPLPQPSPAPQPQTEPYEPPEPKTLSPAESKYWRDYYDAQDRKVERPTLKRPNPIPSLSPDPSPDPNCPPTKQEEEEKRKKCKSGKFLYRGDSRDPFTPDENGGIIFANGFTAKGTNAKFEDHINLNPKDSAFISASQNKQVGIDYATRFGNENGYLYKICDPGEDLGPGVRRDAIQIYNLKKYRGRHPFAYQKEIAFKGGIPSKYIMQSTYYSQDQKAGVTLINPTYNP
jgi:RHS repeat-associated protein